VLQVPVFASWSTKDALALINLEKKLMKNQKFLSQISNEINQIKKQNFFELSHSNSYQRLFFIKQ
jgi:high frequency lysogenization protein